MDLEFLIHNTYVRVLLQIYMSKCLTRWPLRDVEVNLPVYFTSSFCELLSDISSTSCEIGLSLMPQKTFDDKSSQVQEMVL